MKRFAFVTDIHLDEQFPLENNVNTNSNWERLIEDLKNKHIGNVIFGGDIGSATSHEWFFNTLKSFSIKLILGNHDKYKEVSKYLQQDDKNFNPSRNELYFKCEDDTYSYIFLDSSSDEISRAQLEWLKLEISSLKKILVFIHHPVIEIKTKADQLFALKNREALKSILIESGQDVSIFCGHYHLNDVSNFKNITQYATQAASFQLSQNFEELIVDNSVFGYRLIDIYEDKIDTSIVNFTHSFEQVS